jgi:hypothetical protein
MGNDEIKKIRSQKFFSELNRVNCTQKIQGNADDLNEKIALKASISGIETGAQYTIQLFSVFGQSNTPLNDPQPCLIDEITHTAVLTTSIIMTYYFEKPQPLLVSVNKMGGTNPRSFRIDTTLGCIMGSRRNTLVKPIPEANGETLNIAAEKIQNTEDILVLRLDMIPTGNANFAETKNKLVFHLTNSSKSPIYNSECLNNLGKFNEVKIPAGLLGQGIILSFINDKRKVVAEIQTNVQELINKKTFEIINHSKKFSCVSNSFLTRNYTFVDYLKAGVQLGLSIAIDFTGSNGPPTDSRSLHFINGQEPNQYERAIYACGNIMAYYDYDQLFPCYGFGANINGQPCPLFNLNLQQDPNIHLIENIIQEYHKALGSVRLWGPTNFGPIIRATNDMIKAENNKLKYNVLMILTDGMIDDIDETINQLVQGSFLPLSVIIIGVGRADFSNMKILDADDNPLIDSRGVRAARDLVQFVPFLNYESNPDRLAQEVLAEIPRQIIDYYQQNNLDPVKLTT